MQRTRTRPIPAGRMAPLQALVLGTALSIFGVVYLAIVCNALSAVLTAITIVIYIFAYTPLKRTSTANTAVGAIPGAIPPMIGWAAARGDIGAGAWSLFAIVVLVANAALLRYRVDVPRRLFARWIPHDFERRSHRANAAPAKVCSSAFYFWSSRVCLHLWELRSYFYQAIELVLGGLFIAVAMRFLRLRTQSAARLLFIASIVYLPLLLAALVLTKL